MIVIVLIAGLLSGAIMAWIIRKLVFERNFIARPLHELLQQELATLHTRQAVTQQRIILLEEQVSKKEQITEQLQQARATIARLEAYADSREEKLQTQQADFELIKQKLETEFKVLAGAILDNNSRKFNEQQASSLKHLLEPLNLNIQHFKQELEQRYNTETKERASLGAEIKQVMLMNQQLSREAENLTNALRGNTKQQGDWGEMILESILDYVGLQKGIHYQTQESSRMEDGRLVRPDVVVRYPDQKVLVIDSKVSLVHYERFCAATDAETQKLNQSLLVKSIRSHIDGLSGKKYGTLQGALDCVMMFIPVEGAFILAIQGEPNLWQYAYDRQIILLSPTNLLASMKLIHDFWKRDDISKNAQEIAKRAGALYDKLAGFVENMDKIGKHIHNAHIVWEDAYRQLHTGPGNLIRQAEQMKALQINAKKKLPEQLSQNALLDQATSQEEPQQ